MQKTADLPLMRTLSMKYQETFGRCQFFDERCKEKTCCTAGETFGYFKPSLMGFIA